MAVIAIPKPLRDRLGDEGTDALVQIVREIDSSARIDTLSVVEERFERRLSEENAKTNNRITEEIGRLDKRITEEMAKVNSRITEEVGRLDKRITEEMAKVNSRITEEIGKINMRITEEVGKLRVEIEKTRAEMIKWMFIFWCGQIGAMYLLLKLTR